MPVRQGADLSVRSDEGTTALYTAVARGQYGLVPLLLDLGVDLHARDDLRALGPAA
jgi:ankyrin repeat protein